MKVTCPSCGAEVYFKSRASIFGVCSYCNSTLVRQDLKVENIGKMSVIPQDMSPLQLGTSGVYKGSKFEVVGRQKIGWENGSWNEWYVFFDNGKEGWLADAQGDYMISFQHREVLTLPELQKVKVNETIRLNGVDFTVDDIKEVTCIGSQGELPVRSVGGRKSTSVDLSGPEKKFGNIDFASEENRLFFGHYVDFDDLKFMNLREIDGW